MVLTFVTLGPTYVFPVFFVQSQFSLLKNCDRLVNLLLVFCDMILSLKSPVEFGMNSYISVLSHAAALSCPRSRPHYRAVPYTAYTQIDIASVGC